MEYQCCLLPTPQAGIAITNHFPVRDIVVHSLRLVGQNIQETPLLADGTLDPNWSVGQSHFGELQTKDAVVTFDVSYPSPQFSNLDFTYRATIHDANKLGLAPITPDNGTFDFTGNIFDFSFEKNLLTANGPHRNYDMTVVGLDPDSNRSDYSSAGYFTTNGWDIIEVDNPRPEKYFLTPPK